ncbi:unnamed protein product [Rhizopus stolonifer]
MKPHLQRIAASLLLRPITRSLIHTVHLRPTASQPLHLLPTSIATELPSRFFHRTSHPIVSTPPTTSVVEEEELPQADPFQFIAYAAWHPKSRQKVSYRKPIRPKGQVDAGEDAFFQTTTSEGLAIGVADGVGGWSTVGVDPALFSWTLMTMRPWWPKSGKVAAGSSTACILNLSKTTGEMTSCNLGDSAFVLVRDRKIVYESPSQQHYFNCPYQLTVVPDSYPNRDQFVTDLPKDGDRKTFYLKKGDLILLATDGYFDNMYPEETLDIIDKGMESIEDKDPESVKLVIQGLAKTLTEKARRLSLDPKRLSPWAKAARANGSNYRGGKVDDITCIVTLVCHDSKL